MIDYYGTKDNYIHAKFGRLQKRYNFTPEFMDKYPNFCAEYEKYWNDEGGVFQLPVQIVQYVDCYNIPVHFYFNFTDEPATIEDMYKYFAKELDINNLDEVA